MTRRMFPATLPWLTRLGLCVCLSSFVDVAVARNIDDAVIVPVPDCQLQVSDATGYRDFAACQAERIGLPAHIAAAVIEIESGFNPNAKGDAGEIGLMQVMPPTAHMLGFRGSDDQLAAPVANIELGVRYLAQAHRLARGDLCTTLMKYRAGHKETRFSDRSITYCLKARKILARDGFAVVGSIPAANLGSKSVSATRSVKASASANGCFRRILVPGPLFQTCADVRSVRVTRLTTSRLKTE